MALHASNHYLCLHLPIADAHLSAILRAFMAHPDNPHTANVFRQIRIHNLALDAAETRASIALVIRITHGTGFVAIDYDWIVLPLN